MLLPLLSFGFPFERIEARVPELLQELPQLGQSLGTRAVEAPGAVAPFVHEPGLLQQRQVLRDRRTRHVEVRRDLAGRELSVADELQDLPAARPAIAFSAVSMPLCKHILTLEATYI